MSQKLRSSLVNSNRKGYLQIDFAFAVFIFFGLFLTIHYMHKDYVSQKESINGYNIMQADANDICFLLTNTKGYPYNWDQNLTSINFLGLKSNNSNNFSFSKVSVLNSSYYFNITDSFNLDNSNIYINIKGFTSGDSYVNFGISSDLMGDVISANSICFANYNSEIVKIFVEVWQ